MSHPDARDTEASHLDQWRDRMQDLVDGTLDAREAEAVTAHAQQCLECGKEHSKLSQMHAQLAAALSSPPTLSADFTARVFSSIDEAEELRRSAAKLKAEREFQARIRAFTFDWRDFFHVHMGSFVAGITVIAALIAGLGNIWTNLSASLVTALPALATLAGESTLAIAMLVIPVSFAFTAFLILRTRAR